MLTSPDGVILDANPSACQILGRTREEILQEGRAGLIDTSDPRLEALIEQRKRTGRAHGELMARRKDGTMFPVEVSSVVFENREGDPRTCLIMRDISDRKGAEAERERLIRELQEALAKVRTLSGLLPICASCRKIRDKQGAWQHLEVYIRKNSEADFTHGICPDCRRTLYPETISRISLSSLTHPITGPIRFLVPPKEALMPNFRKAAPSFSHYRQPSQFSPLLRPRFHRPTRPAISTTSKRSPRQRWKAAARAQKESCAPNT